MNKADLEDYHPLYKDLPTYKGKRWGFFDDGDQFALYYRRDVFEDPKLRQAYQAKFKRDLAVPRTWDEYAETAQFITDQMAPKLYGAVHFRKAGSPGNQFAFLQEFRANGGVFFDDKTMRAQLATPAGVTTLRQMVAANKASVPGNDDLDAVAAWVAWLQGKAAMLYSWPPTGRMSENYSQRAKAVNFVPHSDVAGKVGYAVDARRPRRDGVRLREGTGRRFRARGGGLPVHAVGHEPAGLPCPRHAALHVARSVSLVPLQLATVSRAMARGEGLPRHPVQRRERRRGGHRYARLAGLRAQPGPDVYSVWAGADPQAALQKAAAEWDAITDKIGVDAQRAAYEQFKKLPGCYADHTVEALGRAVHMT